MSIKTTTALVSHEAASCLLVDLTSACGTRAFRGVINGRLAEARVAAGASVYALPVPGADVEQKWAEGIPSFGPAAAAKRRQMTGFRGLKPWREPA